MKSAKEPKRPVQRRFGFDSPYPNLTNGVYRFVILTRRADGSMIGVHDRMPVIAAEREVRPYLTDPRAAAGILGADGPRLIAEPVA